MIHDYPTVKVIIKNLDDFQRYSRTYGKISKLKYIKFIRMRQKIELIYQEKLKYVKAQDFLSACDTRDKERNLCKELLQIFNIEKK